MLFPEGDKSAVDVVAHEISHSWMGNLVTTKNWVNTIIELLINEPGSYLFIFRNTFG